MKLWLYNTFVPVFLRHWKQKYLCQMLEWHTRPEPGDWLTYDCKRCWRTVEV